MRKSLILFALFWSTILFAQQSDWKIYTEIAGVKIETRTIECYGNEILTFRISNANNYSVSIMWNDRSLIIVNAVGAAILINGLVGYWLKG